MEIEKLLGENLGRYGDLYHVKYKYKYVNCIYILRYDGEYYVGAARNLNKRLRNHDFIESKSVRGDVCIFVYCNDLKINEIKDKENEAIEAITNLGLNICNKIKSGFSEDISNRYTVAKVEVEDFIQLLSYNDHYYISKISKYNNKIIHYNKELGDVICKNGSRMFYNNDIYDFINNYIDEDYFEDFKTFLLELEEYIYLEYQYRMYNIDFYNFCIDNKEIVLQCILDKLDRIELENDSIVDIIIDIIIFNPNHKYEDDSKKSSYINRVNEIKSKNNNKASVINYHSVYDFEDEIFIKRDW